MKIIYSSKFAREYKKLPKEIKIKAEKQEKIFRLNPFDASLKTHKLFGEFKDTTIYFHSVGDHLIY